MAICYNEGGENGERQNAVVPGYYLVCYNLSASCPLKSFAVVPGYYLVCYNFCRKNINTTSL